MDAVSLKEGRAVHRLKMGRVIPQVKRTAARSPKID
jgi:hypothetical protein